MSFLGRIPPGVTWAAIIVSLFMNLVSINLIGMADDNARHNTVILCERLAPTTKSVNTVHQTFHDVIKTSRDNALKRINTPKELPSDKKTVTDSTKYLPLFTTVAPISCKGFK